MSIMGEVTVDDYDAAFKKWAIEYKTAGAQLNQMWVSLWKSAFQKLNYTVIDRVIYCVVPLGEHPSRASEIVRSILTKGLTIDSIEYDEKENCFRIYVRK